MSRIENVRWLEISGSRSIHDCGCAEGAWLVRSVAKGLCAKAWVRWRCCLDFLRALTVLVSCGAVMELTGPVVLEGVLARAPSGG